MVVCYRLELRGVTMVAFVICSGLPVGFCFVVRKLFAFVLLVLLVWCMI